MQHILLLESRFYGLTRDSVLRLAYQIAKANKITTRFNESKQKAGKEWLRCFLSRHPEISLRTPEATSLARAAGFNRQRVDSFFQLLEKIVKEENVSSDRIYNMDETGFSAVQKPQKVFARKGKHQVGSITSCERGRNITFVCCVSASGQYIPPLVIYPRKNLKMELTEGAPPGSVFACQENGWINSDLFMKWFEHFVASVNPSQSRKVLLILDGHSTHTHNIDVIVRARDKGVIMLSLPPHCTHRLQPLDVTLFKPLSTYYSQCIDSWMRANPGLAVAEQKVTQFFGEAYSKAASIGTAITGFKKCGIWPVNPKAIADDEFAPSDVTEKPQSEVCLMEQSPSHSCATSTTENLPTVEIVVHNDDGTTAVTHAVVHSAEDIDQEGSINLADVQTVEQLPQQEQMPVEEQAQSPVNDNPSHSSDDDRVTAQMLSPLPVRQPLNTKRRAGLGATVLTESPYKRTLEEKIKNKRPNSRKVGLKDKNESSGKTTKKKNDKLAVKPRRVQSRAPIKPPNPPSKRLQISQPRKPVWLDSYKQGIFDYLNYYAMCSL